MCTDVCNDHKVIPEKKIEIGDVKMAKQVIKRVRVRL